MCQYADDYVLYISHKNLNICSNFIQNSLNDMVNILTQLGLKFSNSKSHVCVLSRGYKRHQINIRIGNIPLDTVNSVRYLGMWLDMKL